MKQLPHDLPIHYFCLGELLALPMTHQDVGQKNALLRGLKCEDNTRLGATTLTFTGFTSDVVPIFTAPNEGSGYNGQKRAITHDQDTWRFIEPICAWLDIGQTYLFLDLEHMHGDKDKLRLQLCLIAPCPPWKNPGHWSAANNGNACQCLPIPGAVRTKEEEDYFLNYCLSLNERWLQSLLVL
jgi:hypothetical protein